MFLNLILGVYQWHQQHNYKHHSICLFYFVMLSDSFFPLRLTDFLLGYFGVWDFNFMLMFPLWWLEHMKNDIWCRERYVGMNYAWTETATSEKEEKSVWRLLSVSPSIKFRTEKKQTVPDDNACSSVTFLSLKCTDLSCIWPISVKRRFPHIVQSQGLVKRDGFSYPKLLLFFPVTL